MIIMRLGILILTFLWVAVVPVSAQTTYEILHGEYLREFEEYLTARDEYLEDRSEYFKFQTLVARSEAIRTTQVFLKERSELMIAYLVLMKERLEQSNDLKEDELKGLILYINNEIDIMNNQLPLYDSANTLNDLVKLSSVIQKRYDVFVINSFKIKALIVASKVRSLRKTSNDLVGLTEEQVARIRKEGVLETTDLDRWLVDAPERLLFSESNEITGLGIFMGAKAKDSVSNAPRLYATFLKSLRTSAQYLREANGLMLQIVQGIRFR